MSQLPLWIDPDDTPILPDGIYEVPISWADGDTDPVSLERLARAVRSQSQVFPDDNGRDHLFKVLETRIEGGRVIARIVENFKLERQLGMFKDRPTVDDEEDEY